MRDRRTPKQRDPLRGETVLKFIRRRERALKLPKSERLERQPRERAPGGWPDGRIRSTSEEKRAGQRRWKTLSRRGDGK